MRRRKKGKLQRDNGDYQFHTACTKCSSSDAMAVYLQKDGSYSGHCFSCGKPTMTLDINTLEAVNTYSTKERQEMTDYYGVTLEDVKETFVADNLKDRGLTKETLEAYGVKVGMDESGKIDSHLYPVYDENDVHKGYRIRSKDEKGFKNFKGKVGDTSGKLQFFGQQNYPVRDSSKFGQRIIITGGEIDAMTVHQLLASKGKNYPVVSVPSGESVKPFKDNYEYLSKYDDIILCLDADEVGKKVTEDAAKLLPVGKVRIMELPKQFKDPNDMIQGKSPANQTLAANTFWTSLWAAKSYSPVGIHQAGSDYDAFLRRGTEDILTLPSSFGEVAEKMNGGIAKGEITLIAAGTSIGKTAFLMEMIYHTSFSEDKKVGAILLESEIAESEERLVGMQMGKNLAIMDYEAKCTSEARKAYGSLQDNGNVILVDHSGSMDTDDILDKIEFLAQGLDCELIILDPLQLALSGGSNEEYEEFMSDLLKLVKRTQISLVITSHIRKSGGGTKDAADGGEPSESDLKGSGAVIQVSFNTWILSRQKTAECPILRNTTKITIVKCRRTGDTGPAGGCCYDHETGRIDKGMSIQELQDRLDGNGTPEEDFDEFTE